MQNKACHSPTTGDLLLAPQPVQQKAELEHTNTRPVSVLDVTNERVLLKIHTILKAGATELTSGLDISF